MSRHTKWEYKLVEKDLRGVFESSQLKQLGEDGWELCAFLPTQLIFKRKYEDA